MYKRVAHFRNSQRRRSTYIIFARGSFFKSLLWLKNWWKGATGEPGNIFLQSHIRHLGWRWVATAKQTRSLEISRVMITLWLYLPSLFTKSRYLDLSNFREIIFPFIPDLPDSIITKRVISSLIDSKVSAKTSCRQFFKSRAWIKSESSLSLPPNCGE